VDTGLARESFDHGSAAVREETRIICPSHVTEEKTADNSTPVLSPSDPQLTLSSGGRQNVFFGLCLQMDGINAYTPPLMCFLVGRVTVAQLVLAHPHCRQCDHRMDFGRAPPFFSPPGPTATSKALYTS
jgi:hypothetical protein